MVGFNAKPLSYVCVLQRFGEQPQHAVQPLYWVAPEVTQA